MLNKRDFASITIGWFMNIDYIVFAMTAIVALDASIRLCVPRFLPRLTTSNPPRGFYFAPLPPYRNEPTLTSSSSIKLPILHFSRPYVNPPLHCSFTRSHCPFARFCVLNFQDYVLFEIIFVWILFALIIYTK